MDLATRNGQDKLLLLAEGLLRKHVASHRVLGMVMFLLRKGAGDSNNYHDSTVICSTSGVHLPLAMFPLSRAQHVPLSFDLVIKVLKHEVWLPTLKKTQVGS
ncbi:hypothetical protein E2542_SST11168 [Spatholobus suberectus]|nr:hypothetical protein E2542_SST11168 [Spatholobus suberectus]